MKAFTKLFILLLFLLGILLPCTVNAVQMSAGKTSGKIIADIQYKTGTNLTDYEKERCKLDLYLPENKTNFPVVVWFHGGSLKFGGKDEDYTKKPAAWFCENGIGVAVVNYRLYPKAKYPDYIKDAAAAVAWVCKNISKYNGNPASVFIAGHSAGGYLSYMLTLVPSYLKNEGIDVSSIAGIIPISGQTFTHSTIREEKGIPDPDTRPFIDEAAPAYNRQAVTPPMLIVYSDGDDMTTITQNTYMAALLQSVENKKISAIEIKNHDHLTLISKLPEKGDELAGAIIKFIDEYKRK